MPKPTPETVAVATLIFDSYIEENKNLTVQRVVESLTGYKAEVLAFAQAMVYENCCQHDSGEAGTLGHMFAFGAWLARKHAEQILAHLASAHRKSDAELS